MQTVNFQCGNCNNLMAVSAEYLGQQVRCPHCQAVVTAPSPAAAPVPAAPAPSPFTSPTVNEQEDIFAPPAPTDDLFGGPEAPRIEMPAPTPQLPTLALDGAANPAAPAAGDPFGATATFPGPQPAAPPGDATLPSWMDARAPAPTTGPAESAPAESVPAESFAPTIRKPREGGGWFVGLVFIPLVSYSVLVTILAVYLFYRVGQEASPPPPPNPLEKLPSFDPRDDNHSTHLKEQDRLKRPANIDVTYASQAPPADQIVPLSGTLRLGDLEVEPVRVNREIVSVMTADAREPEPCPFPCLVLTLKVRNVSNNVVFQPMDAFFDRNWNPKGGDAPPLTVLELSGNNPKERFLFGGTAHYDPPPKVSEWVVRGRPKDYDPKLGKMTELVLSPGEEKEIFVCTNGGGGTYRDKEDNDRARAAADAVQTYHGKLLWHVHLRRGVVVVDEHRYVPVATVIGVEFNDEDYRKDG